MNNIPTFTEYSEKFHGSGAENLTETAFVHLAEGAAELLSAVCGRNLGETGENAGICRAVCWQIELLLNCGGLAALTDVRGPIRGEKAGEISLSWGDERDFPHFGGIPVSPLAIQCLRSSGLMNRMGRKMG